MYLCGGSKPPPYLRTKIPSTAKIKNQMLHSLFLLHMQAQKKKLSKRKAPVERFRTLRSATTAVGGRHRLLKKAGENFNLSKTLLKAKITLCKKAGEPAFFIILHIR